MDKGYENERFTCLSIKITIAKKYRRFCRTQGRSQSMTLLSMVEFFEQNGISPDERMHETVASLKYLIKRRFNAMVAIMRSIEKEQTLPTVSMIQALFEQELESEDGDGWEGDFDFFEEQLAEIKKPVEPELLDTEITVPKIRYDRLKEQMEELKQDFVYVLDHVQPIKNRLGKDHLRLDLHPGAVEKYRTKIKNL
ncbi:BfmA/BtgA family mobilization protein [Flagellimonas beolgyonensis]|uniref:BfmA/BtgA family mobilization protein n=1 Tax=Flagellimonas beolgyonensis TaxID=864064 RepID=UPI000F8F127D|nr:BfmA/BtgA family mobilization protein [Allomuricauda beolgyonensis]